MFNTDINAAELWARAKMEQHLSEMQGKHKDDSLTDKYKNKTCLHVAPSRPPQTLALLRRPFTFFYGICTSCKGNKSTGLMPWNWRSCWKAKPGLRNTSCRQVVRLNGACTAPAPCDIWSVLMRPIASAHPAAPPPSAHTQHLTPRPRDKRPLIAINTKTGRKPLQTPSRVGGGRRARPKH